MCSFYFTNKSYSKKLLNSLNYFSSKRGPDSTNIITENNLSIVHNLLSITGSFTSQPLIEDNIYVMFNGEIYNYKKDRFKSDIYFILYIYKKHGESFVNFLDGEYSIVIYDKNKNSVFFCTDIFMTKPLFYSIENEIISIGSYKSSFNSTKEVIQAKPSTIYTFDFNTKDLKEKMYFKFNINQYKNSYADFELALKKSILKRTKTNKKIFIGLSSGYDSGVLACLLNKFKITYDSYTILSRENTEILSKRKKLVKNYTLLTPDFKKLTHAKFKIIQNCEPSKNASFDYVSDLASSGLYLIAEKGSKNNCKVFLSGTGADEIFSDYGFNGTKIFSNSNFGGLFPKDLSTIFPWKNFYNGYLRNYIDKEEYVLGGLGIEARYPFLDKDVVQEFLNLSSELKNNNYKAPLYYILKKYKFPFEENIKRGFSFI
jgi:asparagine synthetase B (glutamine-hydrolysing)